MFRMSLWYFVASGFVLFGSSAVVEAQASGLCCVINFDQDAAGSGTVGVLLSEVGFAGVSFENTFAAGTTDDAIRDGILSQINATGTGLSGIAIGDTTILVTALSGQVLVNCAPIQNDGNTVVGTLLSNNNIVIADFDPIDAGGAGDAEVTTAAEPKGAAGANTVDVTIDSTMKTFDPQTTDSDTMVRDALSTALGAVNVGQTALVKTGRSITCASADANLGVGCTNAAKIPALSQWGLTAMVVVMLIAGTIEFSRRRNRKAITA